ncbi:hypothetical protein [Cytobacillus oceanisediminis]|uniref:hypothetical protein n=1 Tax=Cytobacillus oceanisediminis TaxID=665099 RepID=UPI001C20FA82|nr:hypothetical protein [Cytobacillus oceanisediminis]MBU8770307.1 hypothetical protein [Cytobacillus oceanisediminis]
MKKRQIKKFARKAVEEMKRMKTAQPISSKKIQEATFKYIRATDPLIIEPKLYRDFWKEFDRMGVNKNG